MTARDERLDGYRRMLRRIEDLRSDDDSVLRICVCGPFKSGKTSLVNRMLGLDLPVRTTTATRVVTRIVHGCGDSVVFADGDVARVSHEVAKGAIRQGVCTNKEGCVRLWMRLYERRKGGGLGRGP